MLCVRITVFRTSAGNKAVEEDRYSPIGNMRGGLHLLGSLLPGEVSSDPRISVASCVFCILPMVCG